MRGLQLQEVADAVGVKVGTLSAWRSRRHIQGLVKLDRPGTPSSYDIGEALLVAL
jgi:hypothetical protein